MTRDNYKFLATDLELAREKGFEYFKKSENWPVKEDEFREFSSFVRNLYSKVINDISDADVFDVALIEMVFVNHIIGIFHYNYVKNFCKNNNIELMSGDDSYHHLNPEWEIVENYYSNLAGSYSRIVSFMRNIAKNIVFNRHLTIGRMIHGFFADSKVVGIGSNDRIKQSYIIKNNLFCDNRDGNTLINKALFLYLKNKNNNPVNQFSKLVSRKVIKPFLCGMCDSKTMFIEGIDFDTIERVWLKRFSDAHKIYKGLFLINTPKVLLVTETGKPYSKIITLAFQRRRCNVFNFHHGNDSALVNQRWGYQSLFGHCDNYIVDTGIIRQRFEELNRNDKTIGRRLTKFISIDSSYYSELRKTVYQNNSDHKKIMIMGYPMNLARYADDSYAFYYYKILLEHKLLSTIKDSGYHVTYKAH
ncbi:hypothetical protein HOL24_03785, partial [bacterium]|nr:hypothetical protein [bacterium]